MSTIAEKDMPAPRLELRYRQAEPDDGFDVQQYPTVCEYNFVFPLSKYDIRAEYTGPRGGHKYGHFKTQTVRINLSATSRQLEDCYCPGDDSVNTPFRDGAHAMWDSWYFGKAPIYAIAQGRAMLVENTTKGPNSGGSDER